MWMLLTSFVNMANGGLLFVFRMRLLFICIDVNVEKTHWCKLIDQNGMNALIAMQSSFWTFFQVISQNNECDLSSKLFVMIYQQIIDEILF